MKTKSTANSPASIDELVQFISDKVCELHKKSGQRMDGSLLAYTIRSEYPEMDYTQLGLTRMGDAVRIAEKQGLVIRRRDVNHLELSSPDAAPSDTEDKGSEDWAERKYVRNDIWKAFVFRTQTVKFLNKESLTVTEIPLEQKKELATLRKAKGILEIERIPDQKQIEWAKQFITSTSDSDECSDEDAKNLLYSKERRYNASYTRSWKTFLSAKVVDVIKAWATNNDVPTDEILVRTKQRSGLNRYQTTSQSELEIRRAIIAAITDMTMSELDELAIPIKYIRQHFVAK